MQISPRTLQYTKQQWDFVHYRRNFVLVKNISIFIANLPIIL
jgi:hypothetical protein